MPRTDGREPATFLIWALFVVVGFGGFGATVTAQPSPARSLFVAESTEVEGGGSRPASSAAAVLRQRLARVDRELLAAVRLDVGRRAAAPTVLRLNLFDDVVLDAVVDRTGPTSAGYWLSGHIEGWAPGSMTLVVNGDVIVGSVHSPRGTYAIRSVGDGLSSIRELDPTAAHLRREMLRTATNRRAPPPGGPALVQPIGPPRSSMPPAASPPTEDGSRIDLLLVNTPAVRQALCAEAGDSCVDGGRSEVMALFDLLVAGTNQILADSGVIQRFNVVSTLEADVDLRFYPTSVQQDPAMKEVYARRKRYAADLVMLIDDSGSGAAFVLEDPDAPDNAEWAVFGHIDYRHHIGFAHELGHLMGVNHDRYLEVTYAERPDWVRNRHWPYAFGYVNQAGLEPGIAPERSWFTLMAYPTQCQDAGQPECYWLPRFSNPYQTYTACRDCPAEPLGVPGEERTARVDGPADARRTLNQTRRIVANYRVAPCLRDGTQVRLQASNGQYVVALGNGGGEVVADRPRPGPWGRFTMSEHPKGECVDSGGTVSLHTSDGFYLRARRGGGSTLDTTAPRATPWARFTVSRTNGAGAVRSGDFITFQTQSGHYVVAQEGGGGAVKADGTEAGTWETFKVTTP